MSFFNLTFCFALGILFLGLGGVLGTPVSTTAAASYTVGTWDATISPSPNSSSNPCLSDYSSTTCSRSICVDNVNECGQMYGGCFLDPACTGGTVWPTFSKPPCPSQTCTQSICADYINECGIWYGGCFLDPQCTGGTAWPTFIKPPCPTDTLTITSSSSSSLSATCTRTICIDKINACGQKYGGCVLDPKCTGGTEFPSFPTPPCPPSTLTNSIPYPTPTSSIYGSPSSSVPYPSPSSSTLQYYSTTKYLDSTTTSATCTRSICVDYVNECGMRYGGCSLDPKCTGGSGLPTFSKPSCSSSTSSFSVSIYPTVTSIAITTVIYHATASQPAEVTVTKTSTSTSTKTPTSTPAIPAVSIVANGTYANTTVPTTTSSMILYTGAAVRNFAEFGAMAVVVAAGALFL